ncbi:MAG: hypothetical protein ABSD71_08160 [Bacteroidales bacterium]|jgi:hypothetical protein
MIKKTYLLDILTVIGLSAMLTIFITRPGFSQDTTKMKGVKKVTIQAKIITDNNGKKQEFDTTINLNRGLRPGEMHEMMKDFEFRMRGLGDEMKELQAEMNDMKLPDSGMMDSAARMMDSTWKNWEGNRNFHFRHNFKPGEFDYNYHFDFPEVPEPPQVFLHEFGDENFPKGFNEERRSRIKEKDESLNDVLGDIPMENVKSYSIKDTKDGKRIVIELKKDPFIENHKNVIIIRTPRPERMDRHDQRPQIRKKVIIQEENSRDDQQPDKL